MSDADLGTSSADRAGCDRCDRSASRADLMRVECGKCGWWEEVETEDDSIIQYSLHQLEIHPHTALQDFVVRAYIQWLAEKAARSNGALTH